MARRLGFGLAAFVLIKSYRYRVSRVEQQIPVGNDRKKSKCND